MKYQPTYNKNWAWSSLLLLRWTLELLPAPHQFQERPGQNIEMEKLLGCVVL